MTIRMAVTAQQLAVTMEGADCLPLGGYLAIGDLATHPAQNAALWHYNTTGAAPYNLRTPQQISRLLDGLELTAPGVVPVCR